jgi:hypothetical protein
MQQPAQSPASSAPANFAGLLAALASPPTEDAALARASSESDLGDDVVTLTYDRALRAHARYKPVGKIDWRLTQEGRTEAEIVEDTELLRAATRRGGSNAQANETPRGANDGDLRSASVTIRLSKAECTRLRKHAAEAGVTVSAYLRSCTFEAEALRAEVKAALAELRSAAMKNRPDAPAKKRRAVLDWMAFGWLARLFQRRRSASPAC